MDRVIRIHNVSKSFGGIRALDSVSLEVSRGEVVGLIGPNGSGKTTLLSILRGIIRPDSGRAEILGVDVGKAGADRIARLGVASIYQFPRVIRDLSVAENVALAIAGYLDDPQYAELLAIEYLKEVGLGGKALERAGRLNRYETRLMEIARAMAMRPRILLFDELLSGLSESEQWLVRETIETYLAQSGATMIWVEHAIGFLVESVDRLVVLNAGSIIADGEPRRVIMDERVRKAYLGV